MIMNYDNDIDRYFKGASTTNKKPTSEKWIPVPIITIYTLSYVINVSRGQITVGKYRTRDEIDRRPSWHRLLLI